MAQYVVEGTQGGGKNLFTLGKIHNTLLMGNKVVTNFELYFHNFPLPQMETDRYDNLLLSVSPHITYYDLQFLGFGFVPKKGDEKANVRDDKSGSTMGCIVFDEGMKTFNSRKWSDPSRSKMVDFFIDIRKLQYDLYMISQGSQHIDVQIREALISNIINCTSSKQVFPYSTFHFFLRIIGLGSDVNPLYHPFHVARTYDVVAGKPAKKHSKIITYRYIEYYTVYDTGQILGARLPSFFSERIDKNYYPTLFVDHQKQVMFGDFIQNSPNDKFTFGRYYGESNYVLKGKTAQLDADGQPLLRTYYNQGVSHYLPPRFYDDKLYYYSKYIQSGNYKNPNEPLFDESLKSSINRGDNIVAFSAFIAFIGIFALLAYLLMGGYSVFFPEIPTTQQIASNQLSEPKPQQTVQQDSGWSILPPKPASPKDEKPQTCDFFSSLERFGFEPTTTKFGILGIFKEHRYQITNYFIDRYGDIRFTMLVYDIEDRNKIIDSYSDMDFKSWGFQVYSWGIDSNKLAIVLGHTLFFLLDTEFQSSHSGSALDGILPF